MVEAETSGFQVVSAGIGLCCRAVEPWRGPYFDSAEIRDVKD